MLDLHTFGKSKAAHHLVRRLNELDNQPITRAVTNFLIGRNRLIKALTEISDRSARLTLARLLWDSINAEQVKDAPDIIQSLSKNVAIGAIKARIMNEVDYDADDYIIDVDESDLTVDGHEFDFESE